MTFLHCKLLYKTLEYLGTGIGNGINRMPHSIDQTFFIKCLLIQQRLQQSSSSIRTARFVVMSMFTSAR